MPSAKILEQKKADTEALVAKLKGAASGVLVSYAGLTVEQVLRSARHFARRVLIIRCIRIQ